jgi:hypothetical protein
MQTALTTAAPTITIPWQGGRGVLFAVGSTWGTGSPVLTLTYAQTAAQTGVAIGTGVNLTADGSTGFEVPAGYLTATLSASTGATVNWDVGVSKGV